jgi:hypothetical protein
MSATGLEGGGACAASFHPAEETSITIFQETQFEDDDDDVKKSNFPRRLALFRNPKIPDSSGPDGRPEPINKSNASQDLYDKTF